MLSSQVSHKSSAHLDESLSSVQQKEILENLPLPSNNDDDASEATATSSSGTNNNNKNGKASGHRLSMKNEVGGVEIKRQTAASKEALSIS